MIAICGKVIDELKLSIRSCWNKWRVFLIQKIKKSDTVWYRLANKIKQNVIRLKSLYLKA